MKLACVYHPRQRQVGGGGKFHYIEQAFRNIGHEVVHVQTLDELIEADRCCELVLFEQRQPGSIDNNDIVRFAPQKKARWFQWYFDITCYERDKAIQNQEWWSTFGPTMQAMDLVLLKERDRLREYRGNEVNAVWFDQGCPSSLDACGHYDHTEFDIVLWGQNSGWYRQRSEDVQLLASARYRIGWATTSANLPNHCNITRLPWCPVDDLPQLCEKGKIVLHVDAFTDVDGFYSDRIWLSAGAGAVSVRRATLGQRSIPGFAYASTKTLLTVVDEMVHLSAEDRQKIGQKEQSLVKTKHTYEVRCREIIDYVNQLNGESGYQKSDVPQVQGVGAN